jgi:hypothetical protein
VPEYTIPEILVRSLDEALNVRLADRLRKVTYLWRREKLGRQGRTTPDQVRGIIMKIQAELDTQFTLMARQLRPPTPSVTFQPSAGRRPPFTRLPPALKRSESAYVMHDSEAEQEWGMPFGGGDSGEAVLALGGRPPAPPAGRPPVGSLGPPDPPSSRFSSSSRGPVGPRRPPPDESRQGRFTMGHANHGGCHNCGDKDHMARDCPKPVQQRLLAVVSQTDDCRLDDAEAFLEQGVPEPLFYRPPGHPGLLANRSAMQHVTQETVRPPTNDAT